MSNKKTLFVFNWLFSLFSYLWFILFLLFILGFIYLAYYYKLVAGFLILLFLIFYSLFQYYVSSKIKKSKKIILNILDKFLFSVKISFFLFFILFVWIHLVYNFFAFDNIFIYRVFLSLLIPFIHITWGLILLISIWILFKKYTEIKIFDILVSILIFSIVWFSFYLYPSLNRFYSLCSWDIYKNYLFLQEKTEVISSPKFVDKLGSDKYKNIIDLSKWNFQYKEPLFAIPWKWIDFNFHLYYNTLYNYKWVVWNKWSFDYNIFLTKESNWNFKLNSWSQSFFLLYKKSDNFYENYFSKMSLFTDKSEYVLQMTDTWYIYKFIKAWSLYKVSSISDESWNSMNFNYNSKWQLISIKDTFLHLDDKNYIYFDYFEHNNIKQISDYVWNTIKFNYYWLNDDNWNLYDLKSVDLYKNNIKSRSIDYSYYKNWTQESYIKTINDPSINYFLENKYDKLGKLTYYKTIKWVRYYSYVYNERNWQIKEVDVITREWQHVKNLYNNGWIFLESINIDSSLNYDILTPEYEYNDKWYIIKETLPLWNVYIYSYDENNRLQKKVKKENNSQKDELWIIQEYLYLWDDSEPYAIKVNWWEELTIWFLDLWDKKKYYDNININTINNIIKSINADWKISSLDLGISTLNISYNEEWVFQWYTKNMDDKKSYSINTEKYNYEMSPENNVMVKYTKSEGVLPANKVLTTDTGENIIIKLFYDDNSNLIKMNFPNSLNVQIEYDGLGRLIKLQDVNYNKYKFNYDNGYLLKEILINDEKVFDMFIK